jgi:hypothetical protein
VSIRSRAEDTVLAGLRDRLMYPVLLKEFATAFTTEWELGAGQSGGGGFGPAR